jgi:hypothetical protein
VKGVVYLLPAHTIIEQSEEEGYGYTEMTLGVNDVEPAAKRGTESDRIAALDHLEDKFRWAYMGEQGKRIKAVEDACKKEADMMGHWFEHLKNHVKLPLKAVYTGDSTQDLQDGTEY